MYVGPYNELMSHASIWNLSSWLLNFIFMYIERKNFIFFVWCLADVCHITMHSILSG
jgi:hypothetical protein